MKSHIGKILYGLLFVVGIPILLILWAKATTSLINLPVPENTMSGYLVSAAGLILILTGMVHLWIYGNGLPMNAYPPEKLVKRGIYAITKHPIYMGAVLMCFGISLIFRSASGLWLISPLFTLMTAAYVAGFENERTRAIFGEQEYNTFFSLPSSDDSLPAFGERVSALLLVFVPWATVYEAFIFAGIPKGAIATNLPFENNLSIWEYSAAFYLFTYLFVIMIPLIISTRAQLRSFIGDTWLATIVCGLIYFVFPFIVEQRDVNPGTFFGNLLLLDRSFDGQGGALPSFHVIWAFIAARYFSLSIRNSAWLWYSVAVLISLSCITTGNHSILDVLAGFFIVLAVFKRKDIWNLIRRLSERLANSWKEWRFGPLRIINHGFYGGAAGFTGMAVAGSFLGPEYAIAGFFVLILVIIGAGLWAQFIEGSPKLLRPYGYYGGLAGGIIGCILIAAFSDLRFFALMGAFAMAGPWIQATGRLRCLVQGCCHGRPCDEGLGIRFTHPLSRVNKISGLNGVALHPTQLYSIACNILSGLILIRLYTLGMPATFITGIYFILNGLGRFVEESLRGEAQTPYLAGMRIYQWIAIINIVLGAVITTIHNETMLSFTFNVLSILLGIVMGILVMIASGVDFPESNRRFARLTSN
jgi:protein-S-isoprenylcysteine O-methyltransferase Ste14